MSEQTIQDNLYSNPVTILDKYTCLSLGATTIKDLIANKMLKNMRLTKDIGKKPDVLIINKNKEVVVFIEFKKPEEFNTETKRRAAIKQEINVAKEIQAKIYVVSDGDTFLWLNPITGNFIKDANNNIIKKEIKPKTEENKKLADYIDLVALSISKDNDTILKTEDINPTDLAQKIAKILKNMTFASAKKSLYTFVEVFLFKYLSDINVLQGDNSFNHIYSLYDDSKNAEKTNADILGAYLEGSREQMKLLFPEGKDGTSIVNGQIFHVKKNADGHYTEEDAHASCFKSIMDEFADYEKKNGKFINISKDFKSKLFETFMKNSEDKSNMGQFFTPLKIVKEMVEMVNITKGMSICDPASGVGKFLLEAALNFPFEIKNGELVCNVKLTGLEKQMDGDDITTILAKANMLIYFSKLFKDNNDVKSIQYLANELLNKTFYSSKTLLGTLENLEENKYDLILANPPYYSIPKSVINTELYTAKGNGIESLFVEWIIKSLKYGGTANVVLPDGIFANLANTNLKQLILDKCFIESIISLPVKSFFTTPKKTYILTLKKKTEEEIIDNIKQNYKVFTYVCKSIGEELNVNRCDTPEDNDLHDAVSKYNYYKSLCNKDNIQEPFKTWFSNDKKMKLLDINEFNTDKSWLIENWWSEEEKIELGLIDYNKVSLNEYIELIYNAQIILDKAKYSFETIKDNFITDIKYQGTNIPISECFNYLSGNQGLSTKVINNCKNEKNDCIVLSSSLLDETSLGHVPQNLVLPNGKNIKLFKDKEGIVISRNGYAGTMSYLKKGIYTLTDHAYIIYLKDDCKYDIDLNWFISSYQDEIRENYQTTKDGNQTWSITEFFKNFYFNIPDIQNQKIISEKYVITKQLQKELSKELSIFGQVKIKL